MQTDEKELIARILDGHAEDFGYFLERYNHEAFAIVVRLVPQQEDAEELVSLAKENNYDSLYHCHIVAEKTAHEIPQHR